MSFDVDKFVDEAQQQQQQAEPDYPPEATEQPLADDPEQADDYAPPEPEQDADGDDYIVAADVEGLDLPDVAPDEYVTLSDLKQGLGADKLPEDHPLADLDDDDYLTKSQIRQAAAFHNRAARRPAALANEDAAFTEQFGKSPPSRLPDNSDDEQTFNAAFGGQNA